MAATGRARPSLDEAAAVFMAARDTAAPSARGYRTTFRELLRAFPGFALDAFEPPEGTRLIRNLLDGRQRAPETYRAKLSMLHTFFEWHRQAGSLTGDPTVGLTYPPIERKARKTITREQAEALIQANSDPRDQVPLRFLLTLGPTKGAIQELQFRDLDVAKRTVTFKRRGLRTVAVDDGEFWSAVEALISLRRAEPDHYVLCSERSRTHRVTPEEQTEMQRVGALDEGRAYLWQKYDGRWYRARLTPTRPRGYHGAHIWWYRCAWRAGVVAPGVTRGFEIQSARYTVGRRRWTSTGDLSDLAEYMGGLGSGGSASEVYRNPDALDKAIRRVRRRLRLGRTERISAAIAIDGKRPAMRWWKEPLRAFTEYVDDERDLVELSRVSVTMLRTEEPNSIQLHDAAETLTRAWTVADLLQRAEDETGDDHPLLHGHSLVAIWSALEMMIGDVVEAWLLWWPPARTRAASKAQFAGLQHLPPDEWAAEARQALDRAYRKLNRKTQSPRRLDYYEWLLDAVGLEHAQQDDDPQMVQNLWEMQQARNVFAHKRGVADARFVASNPHLPFRAGDEIRIDRHAWSDFLVTTLLYADVIVRRMRRELGLSQTDWLRAALAGPIRYPPKAD